MPLEPTPGQPTALQQLEAALAAGHLTPELFATLRAQLPPDNLDTPAASPAPKPTFSPSGNDAELPSLLDMFNKPPVAPASPPPPDPPAARPAPASPSQVSVAADAAARQLIEERLAQIRQRPVVAPAPPVAPPPTPSFYPEPPAYSPPAPSSAFYPEPPAYSPEPEPDFYPASQPVVAASPPPQRPVATPKRPEPAASGRSRWPIVVLLVLAVVGALAYFFTNSSHPDETLTSPSLPAADAAPKETAAPKPIKKTKKSAKKKRKKKAPAPVAAATEEAAAPEDEPVAASAPAAVAALPASEAPAPGSRRSPPAAPEAGDDAATGKVRTAMAAYYADLLAPPLHASQHFAPQVERLYIQQNLTPAAIDAELARSFFPENQQAIARIEPGTLRVSAPAADGSHTATFTETMRLYRVSLKKNQQLRTQVRVRFNADYKIVYMRQEKLLANTFE